MVLTGAVGSSGKGHTRRGLLAAAGVGVADIGLRTPTMDDVFLSLTGRAAEHEQPQTDEEEAA